MATSSRSLGLPPPQTKEFGERVLALEEECRRELEQTLQSQREITLLLTKTNSEVEKLSTRELQYSNRVRDMEMHLDNHGREDIRDLYTNSHEVQLRLFMMRSQAEQLQNRQQFLKEYQEKLRLLIDLIAVVPVDEREAASGSDRTVRFAATAGFGQGADLATSSGQAGGGPSIMGLIEAQEDERLRISRQIHDGPTQNLSNLILRAEICERLIDRDVDEARSELHGLKAMINATLQDTRRLIFDLRPMILDDLGLVPTVRRYLVELSRLKGGLQSEVGGSQHDLRLSSTMQVALFRFIQSILGAMLADGSAEHLDIQIEQEENAVRVLVEATGLETDRTEIEAGLQETHFQHRLSLLGGTLVTKPRANRGMSIDLLVPIAEDATS